MGSGGAYGVSHRLTFMTAEIIEHDDIAWPQGGYQELPDPRRERNPVDRTIKDAGGDDAGAAQAGHEGHRLPMTMRHPRDKTLAAGRPAMLAGHIGFGPGFIDEDQSVRVDVTLMTLPALALTSNVGPVLLRGVQCFF